MLLIMCSEIIPNENDDKNEEDENETENEMFTELKENEKKNVSGKGSVLVWD